MELSLEDAKRSFLHVEICADAGDLWWLTGQSKCESMATSLLPMGSGFVGDLSGIDVSTSSSESQCWRDPEIASEWAKLGLVVDKMKDNGRAYAKCGVGSDGEDEPQKVSCLPEDCGDSKWCFVKNKCGGLWNACKKINADMKCKTKAVSSVCPTCLRPKLETFAEEFRSGSTTGRYMFEAPMVQETASANLRGSGSQTSEAKVRLELQLQLM